MSKGKNGRRIRRARGKHPIRLPTDWNEVSQNLRPRTKLMPSKWMVEDPPPQSHPLVPKHYSNTADPITMGTMRSMSGIDLLELNTYTWRGLANKNTRKLDLRRMKEHDGLIDMDIYVRVGRRGAYAPGTGPPIIRPEKQEDQAS